MQSSTEQTLYDFKVGLHPIKTQAADKNIYKKTFSKIIKTLTAIANTLPGAPGYCILGVADNDKTAELHNAEYESNPIPYSSFKITGIGKEAEKYHGDIDKLFTKIIQLIKLSLIHI